MGAPSVKQESSDTRAIGCIDKCSSAEIVNGCGGTGG